MSDATQVEAVEEELDLSGEDSAEAPEIEEGADWNEVEMAFLKRRSIRRFKTKQFPAHLVRRMIEIGRFAPSQGNCQPWKFIVIRDREMIDEMEEHCVNLCKKFSQAIFYPDHKKGSFARFKALALARFMTWRQPSSMHPVPFNVLNLVAEKRFMVFHRAPTLILLLMDKRGIGHPQIDIGICGTNIIMAAHSYGLGTCWVGLATFLQRDPKWRERLGIEEPYELIEAIAVGYPVGKPMQRTVSRETHEIAWYEDGQKEIVY